MNAISGLGRDSVGDNLVVFESVWSKSGVTPLSLIHMSKEWGDHAVVHETQDSC